MFKPYNNKYLLNPHVQIPCFLLVSHNDLLDGTTYQRFPCTVLCTKYFWCNGGAGVGRYRR